MNKEELRALKNLRADLFYQIDAKHGPKIASEYPSIVDADLIIKQYEGDISSK